MEFSSLTMNFEVARYQQSLHGSPMQEEITSCTPQIKLVKHFQMEELPNEF